MSVADELNRNIANLAESYTAAEEAGATMPAQRNFDNLPTTIGTIDAAEASGVPPLTMKSASDYPARDYKVYGNSFQQTYSGKNLQYVQHGTVSYNGITFTPNGDGSVTINGTSTDSAYYNLNSAAGTTFTLRANTNYALSYSGDLISGVSIVLRKTSTNVAYCIINKDTRSKTFSADEDVEVFTYIGVHGSGVQCNNLKVYVQLEKGTTATPYEPYTGGIPAPNPDYPQEIESVGDLVTSGANSGKYRIPITVSGKNLFSGFQKGIGINSTDGSQFTSSTAAATGYIPVNFQTNSSYLLSGLPTTLWSFVAAYNADRQFLGRSSAVTTGAFTLASNGFPNGTPQGPGDIAYLRITSYVHSSTTGTIDDIDGLQIQLEVGSATTSYEPYHIPETTNIILDEPLRKIGDCADYLDFKNQEVTRNVGHKNLDGSESSWYYSNAAPVHIGFTLDGYFDDKGGIHAGFCNQARVNGISTTWTGNNQCGWSISKTFWIQTEEFTSLASWKNHLSAHPLEVLYVLSQPVESSVSLPSLPRWAGTVTIGVDTKVQPSEVFVKF